MSDATMQTRHRATFAALFVAGVGAGVALFALLITNDPPVEAREATFFVNSFKFIVGVSALAAAAYFELGPELYRRGVATRWLPPADVPFAAILTLLAVGVAAILAALTIFSRGLGTVLFARTLGFSLLGAAIAAGVVYLYAYAVAAAPEQERRRGG